MLSECLTIMKLGHNPVTFDYIISPAPETIVRALGLLRQLGAVDSSGRLSPHGRQLAVIPTNVFAARALLKSPKFGCSDEVISVLAMIEATNGGSYLFIPGRRGKKVEKIKDHFRHPSGDHLTLFNIYMAWREACHTGKSYEFLKKNMLQESVLRSADNFQLPSVCTILSI